NFLLVYQGNVDNDLAEYMTWVDQQIENLTGKPLPTSDQNALIITDDSDLGKLSLCIIEAEITRLETLFSADKLVRDQYSTLTQRIAQENSALNALETKLVDAQGAANRIDELKLE